MKKNSLIFLFIAALLSLLWLIGIKWQLGVPTPGSRWVSEAYQLKLAAANNTKGPKVLIVAGSNAMFGYDSRRLSNYYQRPVINLAVNAGLGLPYILYSARQTAKAGDIVLLPLEYALLVNEPTFNAQIIDYVVARDLDYWRQLGRWQQLQIAAAMSADRWWQGLRHLPDVPAIGGTYGAHHLNAVGDQTHTAATDRSQADKDAVARAKTWNYGEQDRQDHGAWDLLAGFAKWAQSNQVCLIGLPTILLDRPSYHQDAVERAFFGGLPRRFQALGIAYLGQPYDFMYPSDQFFDTDHHLQDHARRLHTERVIALLQAHPDSACQSDRKPAD